LVFVKYSPLPDRAKLHPYILSYDQIWSIYAQIMQSYAHKKVRVNVAQLFLIAYFSMNVLKFSWLFNIPSLMFL